MKKPKIIIIILNWNGKKDTIECLTSVKKINYENFETIVADNGSTDGSKEEITKKFPEVLFLENGENLGFAEGNNRAIKKATNADFVLLLNNDTIVDPNILNAFMEIKSKKAGILGARSFRYSHPEVVDHIGGFWNSKIADFESYKESLNKSLFQRSREILNQNVNLENELTSLKVSELENLCSGSKDPRDLKNGLVQGFHKQGEEPFQPDYVSGCALLVRKEVFKKIGLLDSRFFLIWEDADFCYRARKAGFEIWAVPKAKIWHKVSASFKGKAIARYFWWRNRLLWIEKHIPKKAGIYFNIIIPEILKIHKLLFLRKVQLLFLKYSKERELKFLNYKASCKGFWNYVFRKFGNNI